MIIRTSTQAAPDPQFDLIKQQAKDDKELAIQDRVTQRTQDLLRRYGARAALSGASLGAPMGL